MTITLLIILICCLIFGYIHVFDKRQDKIESAIKMGALYPPKIEMKHEYWRFITANFVHVSFPHIFMNCYAIYYLGSFFEAYLGTVSYLYLILMSAMVSSLMTYGYTLYTKRHYNTVTLGASGIFYGFLGAMIALALIFQGPFLIVLRNNLYVIAINIAFTFLNRSVSKTGHLGGLLGGFIAIVVLIGAGVCVY